MQNVTFVLYVDYILLGGRGILMVAIKCVKCISHGGEMGRGICASIPPPLVFTKWVIS